MDAKAGVTSVVAAAAAAAMVAGNAFVNESDITSLAVVAYVAALAYVATVA